MSYTILRAGQKRPFAVADNLPDALARIKEWNNHKAEQQAPKPEGEREGPDSFEIIYPTGEYHDWSRPEDERQMIMDIEVWSDGLVTVTTPTDYFELTDGKANISPIGHQQISISGIRKT